MHLVTGIASESDIGYPRERSAWWAFAVLNIAVLFAFVDRQIIALLVDPIRQDLGVDDTQIGLLQGPAFAFFYAGAALPLGWLVDRWNRRLLLVIGVASWSLATVACGLARDFQSMFLARMVVGIGEACLVPGFFSLMGDYFHPRRRSLAFGLYMALMLTGSSLAMSLSGVVIRELEHAPISLMGITEPWRLAFLCAAAPGPLVILALLTVAEPSRHATGRTSEAPSAFFKRNWLFLFTLIFGLTAMGAVFQTMLAWFPTFMIRGFAWPAGRAGSVIGLVVGGAALVAGALAAFLPTLLAARKRFDAIVSVASGAALLAAFASLILMAGSASSALAGAACVILPALLGYGLGPMTMQAVVPGPVWGRVSALVKLVESLIVALLAALVGLLSDTIFPTAGGVGSALTVVIFATLILGAAALAFASGRYPALLERRARPVAGSGQPCAS